MYSVWLEYGIETEIGMCVIGCRSIQNTIQCGSEIETETNIEYVVMGENV